MVLHASDNIKDYFQHTTLTKILGEPNYETLAQLQKEVRANGRSVPCSLGGGNQGHLGLVTSAATYARINPETIFDRPTTHPAPPPNVNGATQYQIQNAIRQYDEDVREFNLCNLVERTVIQQINAAVNDEYLADLIDPDTGILTGTVPTILHTLFASYGDITAQSLAQKKANVEQITYAHQKPIAIIFHNVNEYATMAEASGAAATDVQLIDIGLIIITNANIFGSDIRKWHSKPADEISWTNFKTHFTTAQRDIKRSQPQQTIRDFGFHPQANAVSLADEVYARITAKQAEDTAQAEAINAEIETGLAMQEQFSQMANSTQTDPSVISQITALTNIIRNLESRMNNNGGNGGNGGGGGQDRSKGKGRSNKSHQRKAGKYCWTHGNGAHDGNSCKNKVTGHIESASFQNKQGGSHKNCDPAT